MTKFSTFRLCSMQATYPNIATWTESYGWIEIGDNEYTSSFIRAGDMGGMVWEGKSKYKSLDDALNDLEKALEKIIEEIG